MPLLSFVSFLTQIIKKKYLKICIMCKRSMLILKLMKKKICDVPLPKYISNFRLSAIQLN